MKKITLILLMAGMSGFAGTRGVFLLDVDVGNPAHYTTDRPVLSGLAEMGDQDCSACHMATQGDDENNYSNRSKVSENMVIAACLDCSFLPLITREYAEEKYHHQVHTHDVPDWTIINCCDDFCPAMLCRIKHQQDFPDRRTTRLCTLPLVPERKAP